MSFESLINEREEFLYQKWLTLIGTLSIPPETYGQITFYSKLRRGKLFMEQEQISFSIQIIVNP